MSDALKKVIFESVFVRTDLKQNSDETRFLVSFIQTHISQEQLLNYLEVLLLKIKSGDTRSRAKINEVARYIENLEIIDHYKLKILIDRL